MDDVSQLERLHREHVAAVRAYVRRRIGPEDADDVVAEVFLVAWRRLADAPAEPRTWLLGVARKALGNRRRTDRRQRALYERLAGHAGTAPAASPPPGDPVVSGDGALLRALAALGSRDREVLLLVTWDGLDHAEAAEVLGIRPGTVAMRVLRARRRLEHALGRIEGSETGSSATPTPTSMPMPTPIENRVGGRSPGSASTDRRSPASRVEQQLAPLRTTLADDPTPGASS